MFELPRTFHVLRSQRHEPRGGCESPDIPNVWSSSTSQDGDANGGIFPDGQRGGADSQARQRERKGNRRRSNYRRDQGHKGHTVDNGEEGWLYIIHFEPAYKHARHYMGFSSLSDVKTRFDRHRRGQGARLVAVAVAAGCKLRLFVIKRGTRTEERRLKRNSHSSRWCPICSKGRKRPRRAGPRPFKPQKGAIPQDGGLNGLGPS